MTAVYKPWVTKRGIPIERTSPFWQKLMAMLSGVRDEKGKQLSVRKLGERIGVSPAAMGKWRDGESLPTLPNRIKLAEALGRPREDLVFDMEDEPAPDLSALALAEAARKQVEVYLLSEYGRDVSEKTARALRSMDFSALAGRHLGVKDIHRMRETIDSFSTKPEGVPPPNGSTPKK